ncbi:MAG: PilW family protein [Thermodesulfobacteriota bacterium]
MVSEILFSRRGLLQSGRWGASKGCSSLPFSPYGRGWRSAYCKKRNKTHNKLDQDGFSLAELLVALAVGSIVIVLIVTAYWSQTKTGRAQQMMVNMQQNGRAAMFLLTQDIMLAGFSDDPSNPSDGTITNAGSTTLQFTYAGQYLMDDRIDNNGDGTVDEKHEKDGVDNNGDGDIDEINELETIQYSLDGDRLRRTLLEDATGNVRRTEVVANDIDRLEFFYVLDNGASATTYASDDDRGNIRKVGISILTRSEFESPGYTDTQVYTALSGANWGPFNDHNRRVLLTTTVQCRNMLR